MIRQLIGVLVRRQPRCICRREPTGVVGPHHLQGCVQRRPRWSVEDSTLGKMPEEVLQAAWKRGGPQEIARLLSIERLADLAEMQEQLRANWTKWAKEQQQ